MDREVCGIEGCSLRADPDRSLRLREDANDFTPVCHPHYVLYNLYHSHTHVVIALMGLVALGVMWRFWPVVTQSVALFVFMGVLSIILGMVLVFVPYLAADLFIRRMPWHLFGGLPR